MKEIPTIFCDIDGVVNKKFAVANYDQFGEPNENMISVLKSLSRDFTIVFITGRWAIGQKKVEEHIQSMLPDINCKVFCKPQDYDGTTAEYKVAVVKELEKQGHKFYMGFDDHSAVIGLMHNHGMFVAKVISD